MHERGSKKGRFGFGPAKVTDPKIDNSRNGSLGEQLGHLEIDSNSVKKCELEAGVLAYLFF